MAELTELSREFVQILSTSPLKKMFSHSTSKPFLTALFRQIHSSQIEWNLRKNNILKRDSMAVSFGGIPNEISNAIATTCVKHYEYSFQIDQRKVIVHLSFPLSKMNPESIFRKVFQWFHVMNRYADLACTAELHVYLYLASHKKELPKHEEPIDMIHANTAFTYSCQPAKTTIHVFRVEEWFKVLIHETFHTVGLDFIRLNAEWQKKIQTEIVQLFQVSHIPDIRFYETYCEMWGEILNSMFFVSTIKRSRQKNATRKRQSLPIKRWLNDLQQCLTLETIFSLIQCVKVLKHNHLKYSDLTTPLARQYQEKTQSFSYYVLKSILMVHVHTFIPFCKSLQFPLNEDAIIRYKNLITQQYNSERMLVGIRETEKFLEKLQEVLDPTHPIFHSLRMSVIEW
jgi:hypothetical protein